MPLPPTAEGAVYPISVVERLTGLTRRRIRYYEQAGLLCPQRTAGGHRLFSPAEVERLMAIKTLLARGYVNLEAVRHRLDPSVHTAPSTPVRQGSGGVVSEQVARLVGPRAGTRLAQSGARLGWPGASDDGNDARSYFERARLTGGARSQADTKRRV